MQGEIAPGQVPQNRRAAVAPFDVDRIGVIRRGIDDRPRERSLDPFVHCCHAGGGRDGQIAIGSRNGRRHYRSHEHARDNQRRDTPDQTGSHGPTSLSPW